MPRYFIDLHDGTEAVRDIGGHELENLDAARIEAARVLTKKAQSFLNKPGRQDFVAAVRDSTGAVRLRLRISLDAGPVGNSREPPFNGAKGVASVYPACVSKLPKLQCFLVAVECKRGPAPVYAVLANTADEALEAVAVAVAPRSKLRHIGGLSKHIARHLRLKPAEVRLI